MVLLPFRSFLSNKHNTTKVIKKFDILLFFSKFWHYHKISSLCIPSTAIATTTITPLHGSIGTSTHLKRGRQIPTLKSSMSNPNTTRTTSPKTFTIWSFLSTRLFSPQTKTMMRKIVLAIAGRLTWCLFLPKMCKRENFSMKRGVPRTVRRLWKRTKDHWIEESRPATHTRGLQWRRMIDRKSNVLVRSVDDVQNRVLRISIDAWLWRERLMATSMRTLAKI